MILVCVGLFYCCKTEPKKSQTHKTYNPEVNSPKKDTLINTQNIRIQTLNFNIAEIANQKLIGMQISENTKEINPYKKYGLDISNYCYSCTLASILFDNKVLAIENYCDLEDASENLNFDTNNGSTLVLKIEKINNAPIYKVSINKKLETELTLKEYYTLEKELSKFTIHDCGDFDG